MPNTKTMCAIPFWDFTYRDFTIREFGGCDDRRSHIGVSQGPNFELLTLKILPCFGISTIGNSGYAMIGGLALRFPWSQNSKALTYV